MKPDPHKQQRSRRYQAAAAKKGKAVGSQSRGSRNGRGDGRGQDNHSNGHDGDDASEEDEHGRGNVSSFSKRKILSNAHRYQERIMDRDEMEEMALNEERENTLDLLGKLRGTGTTESSTSYFKFENDKELELELEESKSISNHDDFLSINPEQIERHLQLIPIQRQLLLEDPDDISFMEMDEGLVLANDCNFAKIVSSDFVAPSVKRLVSEPKDKPIVHFQLPSRSGTKEKSSIKITKPIPSTGDDNDLEDDLDCLLSMKTQGNQATRKAEARKMKVASPSATAQPEKSNAKDDLEDWLDDLLE